MATPELNKALAAFQAALPRVGKTETGKVEGTTKQGKQFSYEYKYADLEDVSLAAMPLLGKHGLAFTALPGTDDAGRLVLDYVLLHESGEEKTGQFPLWLLLPDRVTAQQIGGYVTYFRRYCLCAVTGIAPGGDDDDAQAAAQAKAAPRQQRPQRPPSRPAADPVRTKVTGAEHERLRYGAAEPTPDDLPAGRGPLPPDQDHWAGQPPGELPGRVNGTVGAIQQHFKRLHITDRDIRLGYTAQLAGLPGLGSTNDLTDEQAKQVAKRLGQCKDETKLRALLDRGDAPAETAT
jgi:ERF superfamily